MARYNRQKERSHDWYEFPEPYVVAGEVITKAKADTLDPLDPYRCPHCHCNHASLAREADDLLCRHCGWRDNAHFDTGLNDFITWVEKREVRYGKPALLPKKYRDRLE